jgi:hypothetical protein
MQARYTYNSVSFQVLIGYCSALTLHVWMAAARAALICSWPLCAKLGEANTVTASPKASAARRLFAVSMASLLKLSSRIDDDDYRSESGHPQTQIRFIRTNNLERGERLGMAEI